MFAAACAVMLLMRDLRKRYRQNEKNIQATFEKYKSRYTMRLQDHPRCCHLYIQKNHRP